MGEFVVIQTLKRGFKEELGKAIKYYGLLSTWNNLGLTDRQIQLLGYTAIRGTISSTSAKAEFSRLYGSSSATINNLISPLRDLGLLVKVGGKYRIPDQINLDFSKDIFLGFKLVNNA